ncbi:MAG: phosphatase PAP2 family protein [Chloroflexi bacterium]|nr:phosphatase PAP2 family protein [Chloroflexota bacterium]
MEQRMRNLVPALLIIAAACAVALTALALTGVLVPGEAAFARFVQDTPGGRFLEQITDVLAFSAVQYTVVAAAMLVAIRARDYALAATALFVLLGAASNPLLKEMVQRERPTPADVMVREPAAGLGYPSGHVMSAALIYGYAALVARRHAPRPAAVAAVAVTVVIVVLMAWDRVYNGAHWPSDTAGAAAISALMLAASCWLPALLLRALLRRSAGAG